MDPVNRLSVILGVSLVMAIYTILRTREAPFSREDKLLIYFLSVAMPIIGFLVFLVKRNKA